MKRIQKLARIWWLLLGFGIGSWFVIICEEIGKQKIVEKYELRIEALQKQLATEREPKCSK